MQPVASGVTKGKDEWLLITIPHVPKLLGVPIDFDENRDNSHRVSCRARSIIVLLGRIGHMGLVVRAI
jgi:hypothetical protein